MFFCSEKHICLKINKNAQVNIFLIGYMASGKSTVGKYLAKKLDFHFVDLDAYIEAKEGLKVSEIFSTKGEIYFRKKETYYLKELLLETKNQVVALGGGTPCYGTNMELLTANENAVTVYLKVSIPELAKRLMNEKDHRPLVSHLDAEAVMLEFVGKHIFERQQFYSKSQFIIDATGKQVEEVVEAIVLKLF